MSKIEKFEDLLCWQKARVIVREIYRLTNVNAEFKKDYSFKDQVRRAAISVMLNIAEGFGRRTHKDFRQFLFIAHGSLDEVKSALYVASDLNYLNKKEFEDLYQRCDEDCRVISGLIKSL